MKKVIVFLLSIITIFGLHLSTRYIINEIYISNYNKENYSHTYLTILEIVNYPESYIVHYDKGNNHYQKQEYNEAITEYKKALKKSPKKAVCKIRTNLALAQLAIIEYENNKNLRNELVEVQQILLENKCATTTDEGIDEKAQELYNKIEEYLKNIANSGGSGEDEPPKNDPPEEPNNPNNISEEELKQQLQRQRKQSADARNEIYDKDPYEYYDGKPW